METQKYCSVDRLVAGLRCGFSSVHIPSNPKEFNQHLEVVGQKESFREDKKALGKDYAISRLMHSDCDPNCPYHCSSKEEYQRKKEELKRKKLD